MANINLSNVKLTGTELTRRTVEEGPKVRSLGDIYDEHAKLVFLFDVSISMNWQITSKGYVETYLWPADMSAIRKQIEDAAVAFAAAVDFMSGTGVPPAGFVESPVAKVFFGHLDTEGKLSISDDDLKAELVRHDFLSTFGVAIDWTKHSETVPKRIDLVKRLAKVEMEKRIKRYPKGGMAVITYNEQSNIVFNDGTEAELWQALKALEPSGGTDTLTAIRTGMEVCREKPSKVGVHHFILVTDGEDGTVDYTIPKWVPAMKASGIVLDYIHIGDRVFNAGLQQACKETGGEYVVCNSEKAFEEKFVAAVSRKLLPSA